MVSVSAQPKGNVMPYMYATMLLHEGKQKVTPDAISMVLCAAGVTREEQDSDYINHISVTYYNIFGPDGEGWDEVINAPPEPAYVPHPIPLIEDFLKPEEEPEPEEEEDVWKRLFG